MKFKLFGRLRDEEDESGSAGQQGGMSQGSNPQQGGLGQTPSPDNQMEMGSSLDRTVQSMFSQGYSEEEIKNELSSQYDEEEIEDAVNTAVASSASGGSPMSGGPSPMTTYQSEEQGDAVSPVDEGFENNEPSNNFMDEPGGNQFEPQNAQQPSGGQPNNPPPAPNNNPPPSAPQQQRGGTVSPQVEELIETIVAENLDQIENELQNVYGEIDELRQQVDNVDQRVHDLEIRDDEDQQEFIQKVNEMEEHVDDYQSRIGGLEKAFQQVLPSLVENVRDLTDLVQEMKQERGIETEKDVSKQDISDIDVEEW